MDSEPKEVIVLGAIAHGIRKFNKIQKMTQVEPEELNMILEHLEDRGLITVEVKKGLFGTKVEMMATEKGAREVDARIYELRTKWNQMSTCYKAGDKEKLKQEMKDNKSILPTMMFFGVMDMIMFSMMFSMMGMAMSDFVAPEHMPEGADTGADGGGGGDAGDTGMDDGGGGFDFDVGF